MATLRPLRVISTGPSVVREPNSSPKLALASEEVMEREGCMPDCDHIGRFGQDVQSKASTARGVQKCACRDQASTFPQVKGWFRAAY